MVDDRCQAEDALEGKTRIDWIESVCEGFVHSSKRNKAYYRLVLETLWPPDSGIPGPVIPMQKLREVINEYRGNPYSDLARRIRELQGEEGVVGINRTGSGSHTKYQLVHTKLEAKRVPRTGLNDEDWQLVLDRYSRRCPVCNRSSSEIRLDQDHKIPRLRGGSDKIENWQPLCKECNNFKSTACRNCFLDCRECPWAFPEQYAPIKLMPQNIEQIRRRALERGEDPSVILNLIVENYFS